MPVSEHADVSVVSDGAEPLVTAASFWQQAFIEHLKQAATGHPVAQDETLLVPPGVATSQRTPPSVCRWIPVPSTGLGFRWTAFDEGGSITFHAHENGDPSLAGNGFTELQSALAMWTDLPQSGADLVYGGTALFPVCNPPAGENHVVFDDPCNQVPVMDVLNCMGTFYSTLVTGTPSSTHFYDGLEWVDIESVHVIVNDGVECLGSAVELMLARALGEGLGWGQHLDATSLMGWCHLLSVHERHGHRLCRVHLSGAGHADTNVDIHRGPTHRDAHSDLDGDGIGNHHPDPDQHHHPIADPDLDGDTNANAQLDTDLHPHAELDQHGADADGDSDGDGHVDRCADANTDVHADPNLHTDACRNANANRHRYHRD